MNDSLCPNMSLDEELYSDCPDPSLCVLQSGSNVGLAFGLTIGAGLATTLGALLPFVPFIKRSNTWFLAVGLALAAGVMIYVSFTEIWRKSRENFCCVTSDHFDLAATSCFFGGVLITVLLDLLVAGLQKLDCGCFCCNSQQELDEKEKEKRPSKCHYFNKCWGYHHHHRDTISITNSLQVDKFTRKMEHSDVLIHDSSSNSTSSESPISSIAETPCNEVPNESTIPSNGGITESVPPCNGGLIGSMHPCDTNLTGSSNPVDRVSHEVLHSKDKNVDSTVIPDNHVHNDTGASVGNSGGPPLNPELQSQLTSETDSRRNVAITPDVVSISVHSNTLSDNTNNYTTASVNELFSNSSLLRMNAVIPETTSLSMAGWGEEGAKEGGVDSTSHASVAMEESGRAGGGGTGNGLIHRRSYQEMVDMRDSETSSMEEALGPKEFKEVTEGLGKKTKNLHRMGILTGLAIGLHNFPEGLATFIAALSSPSLGAALAIAIALHNVPEGVCVAMPVYYATGSKWKGFLWAFLSGISEPLGALLGWLVLKDVFSPLVYGITFGLICGMMVFISLKDLLPTAHRFDKTQGKVVSISMVVGMLIMAVSLILFLY